MKKAEMKYFVLENKSDSKFIEKLSFEEDFISKWHNENYTSYNEIHVLVIIMKRVFNKFMIEERTNCAFYLTIWAKKLLCICLE